MLKIVEFDRHSKVAQLDLLRLEFPYRDLHSGQYLLGIHQKDRWGSDLLEFAL
jgi:hypothetical protein